MGRSRLMLHQILEQLVGEEPEQKIKTYFQPPSQVQMEFPCIVYDLDDAETEFADNVPYRYTKRYQVTYISADPDDEVPDRIASLPMSSFNRKFVAANRHHTVFSVYF